ncbi:hypothetical protein K431DRAFT_282817 [Polychaeton citri CBS 116435]|uniref:Uncharacterized protein n=1 Tax=Polychaeton citri CBS 116435 TaxID=1314669 RepID=A0A9P4QAP9_9PEZI|nr:hypothetical protein K431DRAFT_282817 [Polychaeton citri CBS 116435]
MCQLRGFGRHGGTDLSSCLVLHRPRTRREEEEEEEEEEERERVSQANSSLPYPMSSLIVAIILVTTTTEGHLEIGTDGYTAWGRRSCSAAATDCSAALLATLHHYAPLAPQST